MVWNSEQLCGVGSSNFERCQLSILRCRDRSWRERYTALSNLHLSRSQEILQAIEGLAATGQLERSEGHDRTEFCLLHQGEQFSRIWCETCLAEREGQARRGSDSGALGSREGGTLFRLASTEHQDVGIYTPEVPRSFTIPDPIEELVDHGPQWMWEELLDSLAGDWVLQQTYV